MSLWKVESWRPSNVLAREGNEPQQDVNMNSSGSCEVERTATKWGEPRQVQHQLGRQVQGQPLGSQAARASLRVVLPKKQLLIC